MRPLLTLFLLSITAHVFSQSNPPKGRLQLGVGYSTHGTGDMDGISFFTEYGKYTGKRLEYGLNIKSTIHWDEYNVLMSRPDGTVRDASFRYSSAGLQTGPFIGYHLLQAKHHQFMIQLGAFGRFQHATYPSMYNFYFDYTTNPPRPVFEFWNDEKQNTFTGGYSVDFSYDFITSKKLMLGVKVGMQNDTNGDVITQVCFTIGKKI